MNPRPTDFKSGALTTRPRCFHNKCFLWCHVRQLNPFKNNPQRIKIVDKEFAKKLDYKGITFPVTIKQISQIEKQNNININVFGYNESVFPIRISQENYDDHLDLLYIEEEAKSEEERNGLPCAFAKQHYVYIKDFNSLMYQFNEHKERKKAFL